MSYDISSCLFVGIAISGETIDDLFLRDVPEISHEEERFDERTGKSKGMVKVIDSYAGRRYIGGAKRNVEYQDRFELMEAIAEELSKGSPYAIDFIVGDDHCHHDSSSWMYALGIGLRSEASRDEVVKAFDALALSKLAERANEIFASAELGPFDIKIMTFWSYA